MFKIILLAIFLQCVSSLEPTETCLAKSKLELCYKFFQPEEREECFNAIHPFYQKVTKNNFIHCFNVGPLKYVSIKWVFMFREPLTCAWQTERLNTAAWNWDFYATNIFLSQFMLHTGQKTKNMKLSVPRLIH